MQCKRAREPGAALFLASESAQRTREQEVSKPKDVPDVDSALFEQNLP